MKKLIKYVKKNIVPGMEYRREVCGNNYFDGITAPVYTALYFALDYRTTSQEEIKDMTKAEEKIKRYCKKYGYDIYNHTGAPGYRWFTIAKHSDKEAYMDYDTYVQASVDECNILYHSKGNYPGLNDDLKKIMAEHAAGYLEFLKATAAA